MEEALHIISADRYRKRPLLETCFFNVAESDEKLKVVFSDILLVTIDEDGSRNKRIWLKDEIKEYTLMNVSFTELLSYTTDLIRVNKFTLISLDAVHFCGHDFITLKNVFPGWNNKQVVLGRNYRKDFYSRIGK